MTARFLRPLGQRRYKRMFVIVAEGTVTEPEYFPLLSDNIIVHVRCLKSRKNLPPKEALKLVLEHLRREGLRRNDEAWVVVDKDAWPDGHLAALHAWSQSHPNYGFALSNPKFEYWLLLHFEDADGVQTAGECDQRLKKHLPGYDKHIEPQHFPAENIHAAVARAKKRDNPRCEDWPRGPGTTVYRLVENILQSGAR